MPYLYPKELKTCPQCHNRFLGHPTAIYCTLHCKNKANRASRRYRDLQQQPRQWSDRGNPPLTSTPTTPTSTSTPITDKFIPLTPEQLDQLEPAEREHYMKKFAPIPPAPPASSVLDTLLGKKGGTKDE